MEANVHVSLTVPSISPQGNTFEQPTKQLELQSGVYKAIVTGNIFAGKENITNNAKQSAVSLNLFD